MTFQEAASKDAALRRLNSALGLDLNLGVGSSVPSRVFSAATELFSVSDDGSMPERAERVVTMAGLTWTAECDSRATPSGGGGTVTLIGLNRLLEAVESIGGLPNIAASTHPLLGIPYRRPSAFSDGTPAALLNDLARLDRATNAQQEVVSEIAALVSARGYQPRQPAAGEPPYDLAWTIGSTTVIVIAKSTTPTNHRQQVRLGLGELLECLSAFKQGSELAAPVLVVSGVLAHVDRTLADLTGVSLMSQRNLSDLASRGLV